MKFRRIIDQLEEANKEAVAHLAEVKILLDLARTSFGQGNYEAAQIQLDEAIKRLNEFLSAD